MPMLTSIVVRCFLVRGQYAAQVLWGIVHRDLKPGNIMLREAATCIDFQASLILV